MEFTPLTIIAGANASGKSNLFDALMLLSRIVEVDKLQNAFKEQRGDMIELFTKYGEGSYAQEMHFIIEMLVNKKVKDAWGGEAELKYTRLRYELKIKRYENDSGIVDLSVVYERLENLKHNKDLWIKNLPKETLEFWRPKVITGKRGIPYIFTEVRNDIPTVIVPQDGVQGGNKRNFPLKNASKTVLSSFDSIDFRHILAVKEEMKSWKFLQLNPADLRQPTSKKTGEDIISSSGANLAAALFRIKQLDNYRLLEISRLLNSFLPNFTNVDVIDDKENKQYLITLKGEDGKEFTSRVLSEGTLRLLALCILEFDDNHTGLLCFEEPENGIHPYRIKAMAQVLKALCADFSDIDLPLRQAIVNTHSPVLLNEMMHWRDDKNVSVHFSEMRTLITEINGKKLKLNITKILPVLKLNSYQNSLFSEQDKKLTIASIKEYLQTADFETTIKSL